MKRGGTFIIQPRPRTLVFESSIPRKIRPKLWTDGSWFSLPSTVEFLNDPGEYFLLFLDYLAFFPKNIIKQKKAEKRDYLFNTLADWDIMVCVATETRGRAFLSKWLDLSNSRSILWFYQEFYSNRNLNLRYGGIKKTIQILLHTAELKLSNSLEGMWWISTS